MPRDVKRVVGHVDEIEDANMVMVMAMATLSDVMGGGESCRYNWPAWHQALQTSPADSGAEVFELVDALFDATEAEAVSNLELELEGGGP